MKNRAKKSTVRITAAALFLFAALTAFPEAFFAGEQENVPQQGAPPKEVAQDTNKDGKPDRWQFFDGQNVSRAEGDTNFDGKVDETAFFTNGQITKVEKDTDYDGKTDQWVNY